MLCSRRVQPPTQIPHNCTIQLYNSTPDVAHQLSYSSQILHRKILVVHIKNLQKYKQKISHIQGYICHLELVQCNNMQILDRNKYKMFWCRAKQKFLQSRRWTSQEQVVVVAFGIWSSSPRRALSARELVTMGEPNQPQPSAQFMRSPWRWEPKYLHSHTPHFQGSRTTNAILPKFS